MLGISTGRSLSRVLVEELEEDVATWEEIQVTLLFTVVTSLIFLIIFEFSRRKPSVAAVFDRRRATKPTRTPPPLMRSRVFEWVFLSTDPAYIEYSDMIHQRDIIRERKRQRGAFGPVRLPHNVALNGSKRADTSSPVCIEAVDEKEMPQYKKMKNKQSVESSTIESVDTAKAFNRGDQLPRHRALRASTHRGEAVTSIRSSSAKNLPNSNNGVADSSSTRRRKVLFKETNESIDLEAGDMICCDDDSSGSSSNEENMMLSPISSDEFLNQQLSVVQSADTDGGVEVIPVASSLESSSGTRTRVGREEKVLTDTSKILTPNVAIVNGRRLPASIAEYAIAGDLSEWQLDEYEEQLLRMERKEENEFRERQRDLIMRVNGTKRSNARNTSTHNEEEDDELDLAIHPPTRLAYFGFYRDNGPNQRGFLSRLLNFSSDDLTTSRSSRACTQAAGGNGEIFVNELNNASSSTRTLGSVLSQLRSKSSGRSSEKISSIKASNYSSKRINRHLRSAQVASRRPLTLSDQELLRCIGLDTFVMIRFLRFGFDVTFYPFIFACLVLMPTYKTNPWDGTPTDSESEPTVVDSYFSITMNALEPGSNRLWVCWAFAIVYFMWVLRRLWIEWETFIALRFEFLANGDVEVEMDDPGSIAGMKRRLGLGGSEAIAQKDDVQLHLEQYRNSCIVEFIPDSHRRDRELFDFFDAIFPNQVKRAEVLINCSILTKLINERKRYILKYENLYARQFHAKQKYRRKNENHLDDDVGLCSYICCRCLGGEVKKPEEPKIRVDKKWLCCGKKMVKALPYYLSEIKRLNREVEKEHRRILEEKQKVEDKDTSIRLLRSTIKQGIKLATGTSVDSLQSQTGFVEFKTLTAKQSALQCNISGTTDYLLTSSAPDPRDISWDNITVEKSTIRFKKMQIDALLLTGTLFWSVVVTAITSISNLDRLSQFLPAWLIPVPGSFWYGLVQGYLPVIFLEALMLLLPIVFRFLGNVFIRFKTKSETDKFVFQWHFGYRVANLIIIILKNQIYEAINSVKDNPAAFLQTLAAGLSVSSQFFLNNMIVACGTETLWELAQMPQMIKHFLIHKFITIEAKSKRYLEKLEHPEAFEWGHEVPQMIFAFLVGAVYVINVPLVIGVCAAYFYVATKVYTHQALFVYAQPYEGGGKLMYYLNRTIFTIVYISTTVFSINLGLRGARYQAPSFFVTMVVLTYLVDKKISKHFVQASTTLALTHARVIDEDNAQKEEKLQRYKDYKAAKAERKAAVKKARKEKNATSPIAVELGQSQSKMLDVPPKKHQSSSGHKTLQIPVLREESVEKLRQRRAAKIAAESRGNNVSSMVYAGQDGGDGESTELVDFYLYRQPQLNKSLWETKPRPYR